MHVLIVGVHLAATFVHGLEDGLDTRGGLRHQADRTRWSDGQAGDVAATVLLHHLVQLGVCLAQAVDIGVVLLALPVIDGERAALLRHVHAAAVSGKRQRLVHLYGECRCFLGAVTQAHSSNHIALGGGTYTRAATLRGLGFDFLP